MTTENRDGFLHRWSQRKIKAREGVAPDEDRLQQESLAASEPAAQDSVTDESSHRTSVASPIEAVSETEGGAAHELPPLTLQDVQALTRDSDFTPFVTQQVAPEVKNAALKKLFSDPHYNVMDRLDIYIDDYSNLEPLPAPMLRRLVSAHALKMFDAAIEDGEDPRAENGEVDAKTVGSEPMRTTGQAEMGDESGPVASDVGSTAAAATASETTSEATPETTLEPTIEGVPEVGRRQRQG